MGSYARALTSTVGLKFIVTVTGVLLVGFVVGHLAGNLQMFVGPDAVNSYAAALKGMGGPLWVVRLGLLTVFGIHIWANLALRSRNAKARPQGYAVRKPIVSSLYSRTMLLSGLILLAFVVYHLAHFTLGWVEPANYALRESGRHDVYSMTAAGFRNPAIAASYLLAMLLLFMHLAHGVASVFQTIGWRKPRFVPAVQMLGYVVAIGVVLGNVAIVVACLAGIIKPISASV